LQAPSTAQGRVSSGRTSAPYAFVMDLKTWGAPAGPRRRAAMRT